MAPESGGAAKSPLESRAFRNEVSRTAILCLSVSNSIARKSGIRRGESPRVHKGNNVVVPDVGRLNNGMAAVTFSHEQLALITHGETYLNPSLNPLSIDLGRVDWRSYSFEFGQLHPAPFVKAGDRYIVPVPP